MKKIFVALFLFYSILISYAQDYEPVKIKASIDEDVLFYIMNMDVGFSSISLNKMPSSQLEDLIIKSKTGESFKIIDFTSITLNEALDVNKKVLAFMIVNMKIKEKVVNKLNESIKDNQTSFLNIINLLNETDFTKEIDGTTNPPNKNDFSTLRHVFVYNIFIESSNKKVIQLQVFVEMFTDVKDL